MISELVNKQLKKCIFARLDNFNEQTNSYFIKKYTEPKYEINKVYIIKVPINYINNIQSPLAVNWNNNTAPSTEYLKIVVSKTVGKMIYVDSLGYNIQLASDLSNFWSGWLQIDDITLIQTL